MNADDLLTDREFDNTAMQLVQRMQQKGIDPQALLGEIMEQSQAGTFDPAAFDQRLMNEGLIDEETLSRTRRTTQHLAMNNIRRQLLSTDEEWNIILPKIERVVNALADSGDLASVARSARLPLGQSPAPAMAHALRDLREILKQPDAEPGRIRDKLGAYRDVRSQARATLAGARDDLRQVLTLRQEAILLDMGVLQ